MVRHIVMWKLKDEFNGMNKKELATEMQSQLMALKGKINEIIDFQVGINGIHFDKNSDVVLVSDFKSYDDLATYSGHPDHLKVVDFVKNIVADRACIDFEY